MHVCLEMNCVRKVFAPEMTHFVQYPQAFYVTLKSGAELSDGRGLKLKVDFAPCSDRALCQPEFQFLRIFVCFTTQQC